MVEVRHERERNALEDRGIEDQAGRPLSLIRGERRHPWLARGREDHAREGGLQRISVRLARIRPERRGRPVVVAGGRDPAHHQINTLLALGVGIRRVRSELDRPWLGRGVDRRVFRSLHADAQKHTIVGYRIGIEGTARRAVEIRIEVRQLEDRSAEDRVRLLDPVPRERRRVGQEPSIGVRDRRIGESRGPSPSVACGSTTGPGSPGVKRGSERPFRRRRPGDRNGDECEDHQRGDEHRADLAAACPGERSSRKVEPRPSHRIRDGGTSRGGRCRSSFVVSDLGAKRGHPAHH